jgi:hypothetical protein
MATNQSLFVPLFANTTNQRVTKNHVQCTRIKTGDLGMYYAVIALVPN